MPMYVPPTSERQNKSSFANGSTVNKLLQLNRNSWFKKGASICSDDWQDRQSKPLIKIIIACAVGGPMFHKAVDASEIMTKDAQYFAGVFSQVIDEIGEAEVVQVITDNALIYEAVGAITEKIYPQNFWTTCVVHCLNLVLKSICEPNEKASHYDECKGYYSW